MDINSGIKVHFRRAVSPGKTDLEIYNSENRVPVSIKIDYTGNRPSSIYCEVSNGENFIEIWFNKDTKRIYEITVVAVQEDSVGIGNSYKIKEEDYYECFIEDDSVLNISKPIKILRSISSLSLFWGEEPSKTYAIAENCILGIDINKNLCSITLTNLTKNKIHEILGF